MIRDDDDDVYLDKLQTRGVKKSIRTRDITSGERRFSKLTIGVFNEERF
jgi:hypothetical protein